MVLAVHTIAWIWGMIAETARRHSNPNAAGSVKSRKTGCNFDYHEGHEEHEAEIIIYFYSFVLFVSFVVNIRLLTNSLIPYYFDPANDSDFD
jgi:hypothetical protein